MTGLAYAAGPTQPELIPKRIHLSHYRVAFGCCWPYGHATMHHAPSTAAAAAPHTCSKGGSGPLAPHDQHPQPSPPLNRTSAMLPGPHTLHASCSLLCTAPQDPQLRRGGHSLGPPGGTCPCRPVRGRYALAGGVTAVRHLAALRRAHDGAEYGVRQRWRRGDGAAAYGGCRAVTAGG